MMLLQIKDFYTWLRHPVFFTALTALKNGIFPSNFSTFKCSKYCFIFKKYTDCKQYFLVWILLYTIFVFCCCVWSTRSYCYLALSTSIPKPIPSWPVPSKPPVIFFKTKFSKHKKQKDSGFSLFFKGDFWEGLLEQNVIFKRIFPLQHFFKILISWKPIFGFLKPIFDFLEAIFNFWSRFSIFGNSKFLKPPKFENSKIFEIL